ncbi:MAG: hypothetical protein ACK5RO_02740 [Pseudobdellovibrionaceae bacterium]
MLHSSKDQSNLHTPRENQLSEDRVSTTPSEASEMREITLSETSNTILGEAPKAPADSVKVQFMDLLNQFESSMKDQKASESLKDISQLLFNLQELRKRAPRQADSDEIYMDLVQSVLADLPTADQFQKKDCADYKLTVLSQYDPQAGSRPSEPGVERAFRILEIICR